MIFYERLGGYGTDGNDIHRGSINGLTCIVCGQALNFTRVSAVILNH